jgi:hypothetical protein
MMVLVSLLFQNTLLKEMTNGCAQNVMLTTTGTQKNGLANHALSSSKIARSVTKPMAQLFVLNVEVVSCQAFSEINAWKLSIFVMILHQNTSLLKVNGTVKHVKERDGGTSKTENARYALTLIHSVTHALKMADACHVREEPWFNQTDRVVLLNSPTVLNVLFPSKELKIVSQLTGMTQPGSAETVSKAISGTVMKNSAANVTLRTVLTVVDQTFVKNVSLNFLSAHLDRLVYKEFKAVRSLLKTKLLAI